MDREMKRPWFVPSPIAFLNGVLLYTLLALFGMLAAAVLPLLIELLRTAPRLAACGFLGLAVSPAIAVTLLHHSGHRALDRADSAARLRRLLPSVQSWWAGAHAWLVLYGTSVLTSLVMLVLFPPEPEPDVAAFLSEMRSFVGFANVMSLHTIVWVAIASQLFELERRAPRDRAIEE